MYYCEVLGGNLCIEDDNSSINIPPSPFSSSRLSFTGLVNPLDIFQNSRGRPKKDETIFFDSFIRRDMKKFKKEYIRTKLIRGHNKVLKQCAKHLILADGEGFERLPSSRFFKFKTKDWSFGKSTLHKLNFNDEFERSLYWSFLENYRKDPKFYQELSDSYFGSNSFRAEGNDERKQKSRFRTVNNKYCRQYFRDEKAQVSFRKYLDIVFANRESQEYCDRFGMNCCDSNVHDKNCEEKWEDLKQLFAHDFIYDLIS